jgi:hypothetical protein
MGHAQYDYSHEHNVDTLIIIAGKGIPVTARGCVVGWGNTLQVGRSRVRFPMRSFDSLIDLILSAVLGLWDRLSP